VAILVEYGGVTAGSIRGDCPREPLSNDSFRHWPSPLENYHVLYLSSTIVIMPRHSPELKQQIIQLRSAGHTYTEIRTILGQAIPRGTMSYICRNVVLTAEQQERIAKLIREQLTVKRQKAVAANKRIFDQKVTGYRENNQGIATLMEDRQAKLVALAMLYLGEGAKWQGTRAPTLGSSSPLILRLYISLLQDCYDIPTKAFRCRIQHRADQSSDELVSFWSKATHIPIAQFYPCYVDKRTIGQRTKKTDYRGVCVVSCKGTHIQLELAEIAGIIDEALCNKGH